MIAIVVLFMLAMLAFAVFEICAMWRVYEKLGKPGWACLVPIYSAYVLFDAVWDNSAFLRYIGVSFGYGIVSGIMSATSDPNNPPLILSLIALAIAIYLFVMAVGLYRRLAEAFGRGTGFTVGLVLLPAIFFPILAFSDDEQNGYRPGSYDE